MGTRPSRPTRDLNNLPDAVSGPGASDTTRGVRRRRLPLVLGTVLASVVFTAVAFADNTISDGDGVAPVTDSNVAFGNVPCGASTSKTVLVAIRRNGDYGSTNVFKKGTSATVTVDAVTGSGLSASVASPGTIAVPANWDTVANNTVSPAATATVTVNPSTSGAGSGSVTFAATGTSSKDDGSLSRTDVISVSWTAGSCAPVDSTPPVISYVVTPSSPDGSNDWYQGNVTLQWTVTEAESPGSLAKTGCVNQNITADQAATTYSCSATSTGGAAGPVSVTIKRDGSAPSVAVASVKKTDDTTYTPGEWSNQSVTVDFTCTDNGPSGVDTLAPDPVTKGEGENQTATTTCTDNAGNSANTSVANIDVDTTKPLITGSTGSYVPGTWTNQNVVVSFTCADAGVTQSGIKTNTVGGSTLTGSGENMSVTNTGTCVDNAGNVANAATVGDVDIDKIAPVVTGSTGSYVPGTWTNQNVLVTYTCADTGGTQSGIAVDTVPDDLLTTSGANQTSTSTGSCIDNAGNAAAAASVSDIDVDKTAPVVSVVSVKKADGSVYAPGSWTNLDVTVDFACTDALSGVASLSPDPVVLGEGEDQTASTTCEDRAGNSAGASVSDIDVDKTVPVVSVVSVKKADGSVYAPGSWTNLDVTVDFACTDALSGVASLAPDPVVRGEGENQTASTTCKDVAGNSAGASVSDIDVDKTAPTIVDAGKQSGTPGANGWYVSAVVNRFTANDALSGLNAACAAAFPKDVSTGANEGASVKVASGSCTDVAGNTAPSIESVAYKIDLTNPAVTITSPATGLVTIATALTVSGTASDTPSGVGSVTVNGLAASLGAGTFSRAGVPLACGANTLTALATDNAGRTSSTAVLVTRLCFELQYRQPIDQSTTSPIVNAGKYGRVIPVKVVIALAGGAPLTGGDFQTNGWTLQIGVNSASCSGVAADDVEAYADAGQSAAGTNLFRWTTDQWLYNLDTKAPPSMTMTIGNCYRLDVYVSDGTNKVKVSNGVYALFMPK